MSGRVGLPSNFTIQAVNRFGDAITVGGSTLFDFEVTHDKISTVYPVTDLGNGQYAATFTPTDNGRHRIVARYNGKKISGMPVIVTVLKQPVASLCTAVGPGLVEVPVLANATFTITLFDANGRIRNGGYNVLVTITGALVNFVNVVDNTDGTYTCTYQVGLVDNYTFDVKVEGTSLPSYPTSKIAQFIPDATQSFVTGPGTVAVYRGLSATFTINPVSASGIPVANNAFLSRFVATVTGPTSAPPVTLSNAPGGKYTGVFTATEVGIHSLSVLFDGVLLSNTPVSVPAREPPVASTSSAVGAGLTNAQANVPALFTVIARDANGVQRVDGGDDIPAEITGTASITPDVTDNEDGTYTYIYTATIPGAYIVTITIFNQNVPGSPFDLTVA